MKGCDAFMILPVVAVLVVAACGCGRSYGRQACRMENEAVVATSGGVPTAVAVAALGSGRFISAWSMDNATWVAGLDALGVATSRAQRVERGRSSAMTQVAEAPLVVPSAKDADPSITGASSTKTFWPTADRPSISSEDLDIAAMGNGEVALVMLERPRDDRLGGAYAIKLPATPGRRLTSQYLGSAGEYATRIAAVVVGDQLVVAWHEGVFGNSRIRLVQVALEDFSVTKTALITGDGALSSPALAAVKGRPVIAWSEIVHRTGGPSSMVRTAVVTEDLKLGDQSTISTCRFLEPSPALAVVESGLGLVFRDDADKDDTPEFYFTLTDSEGRPTGSPKRISQADGLHGPSLIFADSKLISAAIRSFQRNLLIGLNRFDTKGVKLGGEFQVYADKTDFVRVDLAWSKGGLLMLYAEDRRGSGRVLAGQVVCSAES